MQEQENRYYPPKPEITDTDRSSIIKTVLSLALFIGLFLMLDIQKNYLFLIVLVLFLHEIGHLIAMKKYDYKDVGMYFIPFVGAVVTGRKEEVSLKQKAIITLAGPIPGIVIGILFIIASQSNDGNLILSYYGVIFVLINVINLLPISPLDGGRLFESLFFIFSDKLKMTFQFLSAIAIISLGIMFQMYILSIFGIFIAMKVQNGFKLLKIQGKIDELKINIHTTYANLSDKDYFLIRKEYVQIAKLEKFIEVQTDNYGDQEGVLAPAIRNLLKTPIQKDISGSEKSVFIGIWLAAILASYYYAFPIIMEFLASLESIQP
ncbi:MAG: stage IV sporulation protein FB [Parvicella sp.]|jgi:stage IV sporulation protein FB